MIPSNQLTDLSVSMHLSGLVLERASGGRAMLLPLALGHAQHLGLCPALSYIPPLPILTQGIKISPVFMVLSHWVLTQILLKAKEKKREKKKERKKCVGCGRNDHTITPSLEYVF